MEYSNIFVCLMGIGTVFVGLICLIVLISVMSAICRKTEKTSPADPTGTPNVEENKITPELIAAISTAIAESSGTDISAIRITSIKQI